MSRVDLPSQREPDQELIETIEMQYEKGVSIDNLVAMWNLSYDMVKSIADRVDERIYGKGK